MNADEPMPVQWVVGTWTGDLGKSVKAHANAGITYFTIREDATSITAAFRRPMNSPVPDHLEVAPPSMSAKLEQRLNERHPTRSNR